MKFPTVIVAGLIATGCSSNRLMSDTQPAFTHKAPFLALSCGELRSIYSDPSIAAINGPLKILASKRTHATEQTEITKNRQKAQSTVNLDARALGHQQAAAWALKVKRCE